MPFRPTSMPSRVAEAASANKEPCQHDEADAICGRLVDQLVGVCSETSELPSDVLDQMLWAATTLKEWFGGLPRHSVPRAERLEVCAIYFCC